MEDRYIDHEKPGIVTFGLGGHHVSMYPRKVGECKYGQGSISGYEDPESFVARFAKPRQGCTDDLPGFYEGCPVIDLRAAVTKDWRLAIAAPLVGLTLDDEEVDQCPTPSAMFAGAVADNGFGTLLRIHKAARSIAPKQPGPLDSVSVPKFIEWWRSRGARIGVIKSEQIVWED